MTRDWRSWHLAYDDPTSALSRRLTGVVETLRTALERAPAGPIRLISLCAGDGRDVARPLADHPRRSDVTGCLVELDPDLAIAAAANLRSAGARLVVRCGDAGDPDQFMDVVPADLLMLVGIFGNISNDDVERVISTIPTLRSPGATVIWTRHRREPDLTSDIRRWFTDAGCESSTFTSPGTGSFSVGSEQHLGTRAPTTLPTRLFTFRDDLW